MRKLIIVLFLFLSTVCTSQLFSVSPKPGVHFGLKQVNFDIDTTLRAFYTTDGTKPTKYSKRLPSTIRISGNTVFRLTYYSKEGKRGDTTLSYFTEKNHNLPVISLITDPSNFFDYTRGIYVKGCCADSIDPYLGANFWKNWERNVNITFFEPNGKIGFSQDAGVKIFGGYSVGRPQKSLAIIARSTYGNKRFNHQIFPSMQEDKFKSFLLRNAGSDMQEAHVRDVFATQLVKSTGIDIQEYRPTVVYLNGEYWGIYNLREKINEHYIESHYNIDKDSLIIMRHRNGKQHGSVKPYRNLISYLSRNRLVERKALDYVSSQMDIDNYILYNICETYTANGDAGGNIRYFKGVNPSTKWRWIFYDLDMGLNMSYSKQHLENTIQDFTTSSSEKWPNPAWSTLIIRKILENDSLKHLYINQFCDLLNTNFSKTFANQTLDRLVKDVESEIDFHLKRWKISRKGYDKSVQDLRLFINERPQVLFKHLQEKFNLDSLTNVKVLVNDKEGKVKFNTLKIKEEFNGIYFKGVPLKLEAIASFDYDFVGWKGRKETHPEIVVSINEETVFEPVFKQREWSIFNKKLIISEVNTKYKGKGDWIEVYNNSDKPINMKGFLVKDEKEKHLFSIKDDRVVEPRGFVIICKDKAEFTTIYGNDLNVVGGLDFGFNDNDIVKLYDNNKRLIHYLDLSNYQDEQSELNLSISDLRNPLTTYFLEKETPGKPSLYYLNLLKQEAEDAFYKKLFFYTGISAGCLVIFLLIVYFTRKRSVS